MNKLELVDHIATEAELTKVSAAAALEAARSRGRPRRPGPGLQARQRSEDIDRAREFLRSWSN